MLVCVVRSLHFVRVFPMSPYRYHELRPLGSSGWFSQSLCSSSKKTLRIWAIFLFGKCGILHI